MPASYHNQYRPHQGLANRSLGVPEDRPRQEREIDVGLIRCKHWLGGLFNYYCRQTAENTGNWMCPCVIRDHFSVILKVVQDSQAKPIDEETLAALGDAGYHGGMIAYGDDYSSLTETVWAEHYLSRESICR